MPPILPFLSFVIITSITPGPNNISCMAFSMNKGYRSIIPYILGIGLGVALMMLVCASLVYGLSTALPRFIDYSKYIGGAYILFLAFKVWNISADGSAGKASRPTFVEGLLLQLVNPKSIVFGLTIFTTFLADIVDQPLKLGFMALFLGLNTVVMVSIWALAGSYIQKYLKNQRTKRIFSLIMVISLIYVAVHIVFF